MATEIQRETTTFEQVSRTTGRLFKYALLGGTLVGIVALAILLAYVVNDAIRPLSAAPGWYLVFFLTLVVPTVGTVSYLNQRDDASLSVGATAFGLPLVGVVFGAGISAVFIDVISPLVLLAYLLAFAVAIAIPIGTSYLDVEIPFTAWFVLSILGFVASFAIVPGFVLGFPFVPTDGISMGISVGVIAALAARSYVSSRWDGERTADIAAVISFLACVIAAPVGQVIGVGAIPTPMLVAMAGVPLGLYVADISAHRTTERVGLSLPIAIVGGALLGAFLVKTMGFAGPQSWLSWRFITAPSTSSPESAGFYPAIVGSVMLMFVVALVSFPIGVGAAVYLEDYAPNNRLTRIIKINVSNLAGVPSVVYGLLGAGLFVNYLGPGVPVLPPSVASVFGLEPIYVAGSLFGSGTIVVGGLALALLILPIIIISSQEAIRAVPDDMRQASYGMGATQWQTVKNVILPRAFPGILTGTILGLGRAIGETAPLLMIGAAAVSGLPTTFDSVVAAMPMQIYAWTSILPDDLFYQRVAPAGVIVLLIAMLTMNSVAIALRNKFQRGE
ncbi:phosphate ABC transporter permease PstA [Haladaptatus sp. DFWS20]|uniref:phosphate ABC transporter permease PstA n=1 Tax=Haladaptatus sp. DFWS20 TaxID=3403467 RepID=UPI003EBF65F5